MRVKYLFLSVTLWLVVITPTIAAQGEDVEEIRSLIERVARLMQAGNLAALDEIYSSGRGVHIIEGAGVNHGWEDYRDNHLKPELEAFENFEYRYFAIEPLVKGDLAYAAFRYELSAYINANHIEREGRGTIILEKMGDQWKIVHSHTSGRSKS